MFTIYYMEMNLKKDKKENSFKSGKVKLKITENYIKVSKLTKNEISDTREQKYKAQSNTVENEWPKPLYSYE